MNQMQTVTNQGAGGLVFTKVIGRMGQMGRKSKSYISYSSYPFGILR